MKRSTRVTNTNIEYINIEQDQRNERNLLDTMKNRRYVCQHLNALMHTYTKKRNHLNKKYSIYQRVSNCALHTSIFNETYCW